MSLSTLFNYNIFELIPVSRRYEPENIIFFNIVKEIVNKHLIDNIQFIIFLDNIDNMREDLVDLAAEELHVEFYDYKAPVEKKREIVKTSFLIHMKKGTRYAVELTMNMFFKNAQLQEWFEYEGIPGTFKIKVDADEGMPDLIKLEDKIENTKRKSQTFIGLETTSKYSGTTNYGNGSSIFSKIRAGSDMSNTYYRVGGSIFTKIRCTIIE